MAKMDANRDGVISWEEFLNALTAWLSVSHSLHTSIVLHYTACLLACLGWIDLY
jgi:hypothetical protein